VQSLTTPGSWESPGCLTAKNFSKATGKRTHLLPVSHGSYSLLAASAFRLRLAASVVRGVAASSCLQWPLAPLLRSGSPPALHSNAHLGSAPVHLRLAHAAEPPETPGIGTAPHVRANPIALCPKTRSICSVRITPACGRLLNSMRTGGPGSRILATAYGFTGNIGN
jgi:hypothetical protein